MGGSMQIFLLAISFVTIAPLVLGKGLDQYFIKTAIRESAVNNTCQPKNPCKDNFTCCVIGPKSYGCCDFLNATCCLDHRHCCPHGYVCDLEHNVCKPGHSVENGLRLRSLAVISKDVGDIVCPGGQATCPDGSTCCKIGSDMYGCCPIPEAVCCSDMQHCCPKGYTCDTSAGTCNKKGDIVKALKKIPARGVNDVTCPDGIASCPDGATCCKISSGQYGCCPLPKAVCCSDLRHCCPEGYTCTAEGECKKGDVIVEAVTHLPPNNVSNIPCKDGSSCPDGNTCCMLVAGKYGCCPFKQAECCSDRIHCCPNGYTCDVEHGMCIEKNEIVEMTAMVSSGANDVTCADSSICPDGTTCCKLSTGQYGCCPYPKAVCCKDQEHCCPNGYTCDVTEGMCKKGEKRIRSMLKIPAKRANDITCADSSLCPDGTTCCKLSTGQYGCCPYPKAVCCKDQEHCCPNGYTCDVAEGMCKKGEMQVPFLLKIPARKSNDIVCPDGATKCDDGNTCCKLPTGGYGCCPYDKAVCCQDLLHCCPNGYTCDVSHSKCVQGDKEVPAKMKLPARKSNDISCPDKNSTCPDATTCCKWDGISQYACCPLPEAVCCDDLLHCCPKGSTCGKEGACEKKSTDMVAIKTSDLSASVVVCPDGTSACPDGSTCCKLSSGAYGCCPLPKAVCCKDHLHCCPSGYDCDAAGECKKKGETIKALMKIPASASVVVCPDGTSACPDGSTCCKLSSGAYGCCPVPKAVCCKDHLHCCPSGYDCDAAAECKKKGETIKAVLKIPAISIEDLTCPDKSSCEDSETCCKLKSGDYGCCPFQKATCCSDQVHCCPEGHTCNIVEGNCSPGDSIIKASTPFPAKYERLSSWLSSSEKSAREMIQKLFWGNSKARCVMCPDDSECPDFNTCCQLADGGYGCCNLPSATCCSDHTHCCPNGYSCDVEHGTCVSEEAPDVLMLEMSPTKDGRAHFAASAFDEI